MSSALAEGLGLALASACALDVGFLLQQQAAARAPALSLTQPLASASALLASRRWTLGFSLGLGGWALYFAALTLAPLSLVQTVAASGIGLLVVLVACAGRTLPARRERVGAVLATVGLMALAASIGWGRGTTSTAPSSPELVALAALGGAALLLTALAWQRRSAALGGLAAGLFYGLGDVASKAMLLELPHHATPVELASSPLLYATAAAHGMGFLVLQRSFQEGAAITSLAPMTAAMTLLPMAAGVLLLGEHLPAGGLAQGLRIAAFAGSVAGAWMLAVRGAPATPAGTDGRSSAAPSPAGRATPSRRARRRRRGSGAESPAA